MRAKTEMRILNLYQGQPIKKAVRALEIIERWQLKKQLDLRCKLVGLKIGG